MPSGFYKTAEQRVKQAELNQRNDLADKLCGLSTFKRNNAHKLAQSVTISKQRSKEQESLAFRKSNL